MRLLQIFLILLLASPVLAGEKWALLVGVDEYETRQITPLNYAVRDVTAVAKVLEQTGVPKNNIFLMTDKGAGRSLATGTNIIWRLGWLAQRMQPDDTLFFYFSGHGLEKGGSTYLLSYDSDIGSEVTLKRTAVRMAELKEIAKTMKASTVVTFMDACRNDPQAGKSVSSPNAMSKGMAKDLALVAAPSTEQHKTLNATFYSCSPGERSWESEETGHGFFSYHVMKGLLGEAADPNGQITVNSLETYLSQSVSGSVDRAIGMKQTPWTNRQGTAGGGVVLAAGKRVEQAEVPNLGDSRISSNQGSVVQSMISNIQIEGEPVSNYQLECPLVAGSWWKTVNPNAKGYDMSLEITFRLEDVQAGVGKFRQTSVNIAPIDPDIKKYASKEALQELKKPIVNNYEIWVKNGWLANVHGPFLKLNVSTGETWETSTKIEEQTYTTIYTVHGIEEVEVPAGRFRALKIVAETDVQGSLTRNIYWYSNETGGAIQYVRFLSETEGFDTVLEGALADYKVD